MTAHRAPAPATPGRRTDALRNRERLLAAARDVFAETGPEASLNEIARRAGVGPGTLYRHFPQRSALVTAVLQDRIERLCALAEDLLSGADADAGSADAGSADADARSAGAGAGAGAGARAGGAEPPGAARPDGADDDVLARWLRAFLDHARVNQGMGSALLVGETGQPGPDCHRLILDAAAGVLARAQARGTARPDLTPEDLVQLVVGIALSTARAPDPDQPGRLLDLVLDAVRPRPGVRPQDGDRTA